MTKDRKLIKIAHDLIDPSSFNVRPDPPKKAVEKMAASIRANGVIHAPLVAAKKGGRFEIIAGRCRFEGNKLAGNTHLWCEVADESMQPADLIAASLAENVSREEMSDLQTFQAFSTLALAGRSVEDIADSFSMTKTQVLQSLAIGKLPRKVLAAADQGDLYSGALNALTAATPSEFAAWQKLKGSNQPRTGWAIKEWLRKRAERIPTSYALFDLALYKGPTVEDLFADETRRENFLDQKQFWKLQTAAIEAECEKLKAAGWLIDKLKDGEFRDWEWQRAAKAKGGRAVVAVYDSGEVIIKTGIKRKKAAGSGSKKKGKTTAAAMPELTGALADLCIAHRHLAIQSEVIEQPSVGLALAVTLLATKYQGFSVDGEEYKRLKNEKHRSSVEGTPARRACLQDYDETYRLLGMKRGGNHWNVDRAAVFRKAFEYDDQTLIGLLASLVSEKFEMGWHCDDTGTARLVDAVADAAGLEGIEAFSAEPWLFAGIRTKPALEAVLVDIEPSATVAKTATLAQIRSACRKLVTNNGGRWVPRWLRFPAAAYTKKHGLGFIGKK